MPSPNPLERTNPLIHLPLITLAVLFTVPLLWLLLTSLQPREQIGKIPPEWLPRQSFISVNGEKTTVTPPAPVGSDKLLVEPTAGPELGKLLLVEPSEYSNEQVKRRIQVADRTEEALYPAKLVQVIPGRFVIVKEWFLSKYSGHEARVFYVAPGAVERKLSPVLGNYPEAIRALTASEKD